MAFHHSWPRLEGVELETVRQVKGTVCSDSFSPNFTPKYTRAHVHTYVLAPVASSIENLISIQVGWGGLCSQHQNPVPNPTATPLSSLIQRLPRSLCLMGGEPRCHSDYRNNGHRTPNPRWLKTQGLAELGPVALPDVEEEMIFPPRALSTERSSPQCRDAEAQKATCINVSS